MPRSVKIKVHVEPKTAEVQAQNQVNEPSLSYRNDENQSWQGFAAHHRLGRHHELALDPWLDEVAAALVTESVKSTSAPVKEAPLVTTTETVIEFETKSTPSGLSAEKQKAVEEIFTAPKYERWSPFEKNRPPAEVVNPLIMVWYLVKDKFLVNFGRQLVAVFSTGWWLIPIWFIGELWSINQQQKLVWPQWLWLVLSWLWPILCWFILGWLRSSYVDTVKEFLSQLWPVAAVSALTLAVVELLWLGELWTWLNLLTLPLLVILALGVTSWYLSGQGRLNH